MSLRGQNTGGYTFPLPEAYDDTADFSVFLWLRRGGAGDAGDRILTIANAARARGVQVHLGGSVGGSSSADDVVVSVGSGVTSGWGSASAHGGRGRAIIPAAPDTQFASLAFSVRGPGAADNTGSSGAQQIHELWWNGTALPESIASTATATNVPNPGGRWSLLCRDSSVPGYFDGWVAEVAAWQGHRLTADEAALLHRGAAPSRIRPERLLFYRSCRSDLTAETGETPATAVGTGGTMAPAVHPPLLIAGSRAAHGHGATSPGLTPTAGGGPVMLAAAGGRHGVTSPAAAVTAAPGALGIEGARHALRNSAPWFGTTLRLTAAGGRHETASAEALVLFATHAAETLVVPPEHRVTKIE